MRPLFGSAVNDGSLAKSKSPLQTFLAEGAADSPEAHRERYAKMFDANVSGFGGGDSLSSALSDKMRGAQADTVNNIRSTFLRNSPFDYAEKMGVYQGLSDMRARKIMADKAAEKQREMEREARRKQTAGAVLGTGGAIAGGLMFGPAGALIGGGAGGMIGSA